MIPGIAEFAGPVLRAAPRTRHGGLDPEQVDGRRVALFGTAAGVVPIAPWLVGRAGTVKVFQRVPGWVLPRPPLRPTSVPTVSGTPLDRAVEYAARGYLRARVADPWLRRRLTPDRRDRDVPLLFSNDYYPALQRANCTLITWPIAGINAHGVRTADGIEHRVDVIVLAAGARGRR